jgi:hypothetical protein
MKWLLLVLVWVGTAASAQDVVCPNGIPAANNPSCIPPDNPMSPYYQGNSQQPDQAAEPKQMGHWELTWGSVATDGEKGVLGSSVGQSSKNSANSAAVKDCQAKGGEKCQVDLAFFNQCAAMVAGHDWYRVFSAGTVEEASHDGISECSTNSKNCRILYSVCSKPQLVRY